MRLGLLSPPTLRTDAESHLLSRKDAALLAVLAIEGTFPRDRLAAWLWPDQQPAAALSNLRQRRFRLARLANAPIIEGQQSLELARGVEHDLAPTLDDFRGRHDGRIGEVLDGLTFDAEPEFHDWLRGVRLRFRARRAEALRALIDEREAANDLAGALDHARQLCADEPLAEHAHRRLMQLHLRRADPAAALEVYRDLSTRLDRELGEWPGAETSDLAAAIRLGQTPAQSSEPTLPTSLLRPPRLVGREPAWQALELAWQARRVALIRGAAGIGKSRLLADFAATRTRVVSVTARLGDRQRPYALMARLLERLRIDPELSTDASGGDPGIDRWAERELAIIARHGDGTGARADPLRIEQAMLQVLKASALDAIALDDLQQADVASLELLPRLGDPTIEGPRWLLAVRDHEMPDVLVEWVAASGGPLVVDLMPLAPQAIGELVACLDVPHLDGEHWSDALFKHAGGNPLFVLETLRGVMADPLQFSAADRRSRVLPAPVLALQIISGRLAGLSQAAVPLAQAAAVFGAPMTVELAGELLDTTPSRLLAPWAELERAQLLAAGGLVHDLVREAVLGQLPNAVSQWLHGRAAAALQRRTASPASIAVHWSNAARFELAAVAYREAAAVARRAGRPQEEVSLIDQAAGSLAQAGFDDRALAMRIESIEARQLALTTDDLIAYTCELVAQAGHGPNRGAAHVVHAEALLLAGRIDEAMPFCDEAMACAGPQASAHDRLLAARVSAIGLSIVQRIDEALALLEAAAPRADDEALPARDRQLAWSTRSFVHHRGGQLSACADALSHSIALARQFDDVNELLPELTNLMGLQVNLGRVDDACETLDQARAVRAMLGQLQGIQAGNYELHSGIVLLASGRPMSALDAFERARVVFDQAGSASWRASAENWLANAWLRIGQPDRALAVMVPSVEPIMAMTNSRRAVLKLRAARALGGDRDAPLADCLALIDVADPTMRATIEIEHALEMTDSDAALAQLHRVRDATFAREQFGIATRSRFAAVDICVRAGRQVQAAQEALDALHAHAATRASDVDIAPALRRAVDAVGPSADPVVVAMLELADLHDNLTLDDLPRDWFEDWHRRAR
ncbi:LuxR family transcriptional regulator [soil metagenome]